VTRQIDVSTNMLLTQYCPRNLAGSEFYIPGTDPVEQCNVHTGPGLYPDTTGVGALYPTTVDTTRPGTGVVVPGAVAPIQRGRSQLDTSRRFRDSALFALPPRPRDTLRPPDTTRIRPRPDTTRPRPDTTRSIP
jgi:hypothetical protein